MSQNFTYKKVPGTSTLINIISLNMHFNRFCLDLSLDQSLKIYDSYLINLF